MPDAPPAPRPARSNPQRARRGLVVFVLVALAGLGGAEWVARTVPASAELLRYRFAQEFNLERWGYLNRDSGFLAVDDSVDLLTPRSEAYTEGPEPGRPPFDRVDRQFRVRTNAQGYRAPEFGPPGPGVRRVVALGDSVTWAKGIHQEDRWTELLQQRLGAGWEVWNLGVEGSTSIKVRRTLAHALELQPDLIVLQASANDGDLTRWRVAQRDRFTRTGMAANSLLARWELARRLTFLLRGDPFVRAEAALLAETATAYGPAVVEFFDQVERAGVPVVLLSFRYADGRPYGQHVREVCEARTGPCRAIVDVDLDEPLRWLEPGHAPLDAGLPEPDWVAKAELSTVLEPARLADVFPYHRFFLDIVHPDETTQQIVAAQLEGPVRELVPGPAVPGPEGPEPGAVEPSEESP